MPSPLTEEETRALNADLPDGTVLVVRHSGGYGDGEKYEVIWKNQKAALGDLLDECWLDSVDAAPMELWQYAKYGDAVFRVEDAPLLKH